MQIKGKTMRVMMFFFMVFGRKVANILNYTMTYKDKVSIYRRITQ